MNALLANHQERPLHPSIQAKLELLDCIQKGDYQRVKELAYALSKVNNTNPQLYSKISSFVQEHQEELNDKDSEENEEEPQIENIDDDFVEGKEYDSDEEIHYESDEEQEAEDEHSEKKIMTSKPQIHKKELFKDVRNTMERRSVSNKKLNVPVNNTYQFKSPSKILKNPASLKPSASKPNLHKNSAIGKARNVLNH